jgi:hypothetical protein
LTDAICINQKDKEERGCQVQQMKDIFRNAERVLFYINQPTRMTDFLIAVLEDFQDDIIPETFSELKFQSQLV